MRSNMRFAGVVATAAALTACTSIGSMPSSVVTNVELAEANYKIRKTNVVGESTGVALLGLIPISTANFEEAMEELVDDAGFTPGTSQALVNMARDRTLRYYVLFSTMELTVRADVVEFE